MISFKEYLEERFLSIGLNPEHDHLRDSHRDEIHNIIKRSYEKVDGGYGGNGSGTDNESKAIHDDISSSMIKAVKRNGKITAVNMYKHKHGRKSIASGTDGSDQGKKDFLKIKTEDHTQKRSWGEVSGQVEKVHNRIGSPKIPNEHAERLTGKPVEKDEDGEHYTRQIGNAKHKKVIVGYPKEE